MYADWFKGNLRTHEYVINVNTIEAKQSRTELYGTVSKYSVLMIINVKCDDNNYTNDRHDDQGDLSECY